MPDWKFYVKADKQIVESNGRGFAHIEYDLWQTHEKVRNSHRIVNFSALGRKRQTNRDHHAKTTLDIFVRRCAFIS